MTPIKLSIIVPSIRVKNISALLCSIHNSFDERMELIVVGPYEPTYHADIKWIKSFRSPSACQQIGLMMAEGKYVTWAADDGLFQYEALNEAIFLLKEQDYKTIIVGRYVEGDNPIGMSSEDYFKFKYHKVFRLAGVPQNSYIVNCGAVSRQLLLEIGGWDSENFEVPTIAHADFSIRAKNYGCKFIMQDQLMFKCGHMPGKTGDHGPIHNAQTKHDLPRFKQIYSIDSNRIHIERNNWQYTPKKWKERFGK